MGMGIESEFHVNIIIESGFTLTCIEHDVKVNQGKNQYYDISQILATRKEFMEISYFVSVEYNRNQGKELS